MRYAALATLLAALLLAASVHAQDDPPRSIDCEGAQVLVCLALALPVALWVIEQAISVPCPEAFPPGEWPSDAAALPAYETQWYRRCEVVRVQQ